MRTWFLAAAVAVFTLPATIVSASVYYTSYHLGGYGGYDTEYTFHEGDLDLSVTAGTFDRDGLRPSDYDYVHQDRLGLGAWTHRGDSNQVDGRNNNDALFFEFGEEVTLHSIVFSHVRDSGYGDSYRLFVDDDGHWIDEEGNRSVYGWWGFDTDYPEVDGSLFAIGAQGRHDNFRVLEVTVGRVSEIPLPFSGLLLLGAVGALGAMRRRRTV